MVAAGSVDMTILKAKFGADIRKSALRHNNDLTFNDLYLMVQRIFKINTQQSFVLKYKDTDGDLVTLADDSDVLLALQSEPTLFVEVIIDSFSSTTIASVQEQISSLQVSAGRLAQTLAGFDVTLLTTNADQLNGGCGGDSVSAQAPPSSPIPSKQEVTHVAPPPPATIQPSSHEQISSDGAHQFQHLHDTEISVAHSAVEEEIPLGADASIIHPPPQFPQFQGPHSGEPPCPPPPQEFGAQLENHIPPTSIPSFPQSQAPPPVESFGVPPVPEQPSQPQQLGGNVPPPPPQFNQGPLSPPQFNQGPPPPQQQFVPIQQFGGPQPTPSNGSVCSTPAPQGPQFGVPPQGTPSQFGAAAPPPPQFQQGPPSHFGTHQPVAPQFTPTPQFGGHGQTGNFGGQAPPPPGSFPGAPHSQHVPEQHHQQQPQFAPPPNFAPSGQAPPQFGGQAPPQSGQAPPQFGGQAPPPSFLPGAGFPPVGAPPIGAPGGPGGNPFARGPAGPAGQYRQSPYQQ